MKFLSSSSSSASTTTTTSSSSSSASSNGRSLAGLLRKLLCFNSLPTHTPDQVIDTGGFNSGELDNFGCLKTEEKVGALANPGIVARLMGLECIPQIKSGITQMTPNSIARCRSMNYDSGREKDGQHRHVKTSLSFRELPTFLELENDEYFVLNFESGDDDKDFRSKANRSEMGSPQSTKRKAERCRSKCDRRESVPEEKDKENQKPNKVVSNEKINSRINQKAVEQWKPMTQRETSSGIKEKEECVSASKEAERECNSENSSPVSVLDFSEHIIDPHVPTSEGSFKSRRKISAELGNYKRSPPSPCKTSSNSTGDAEQMKLIEGKCHGSRRKDHRRQKYVGRRGEICSIAKGAMMESNWVYKELGKLENFHGIGADFGLEILESLLNELVDQLVETSHQNLLICNT